MLVFCANPITSYVNQDFWCWCFVQTQLLLCVPKLLILICNDADSWCFDSWHPDSARDKVGTSTMYRSKTNLMPRDIRLSNWNRLEDDCHRLTVRPRNTLWFNFYQVTLIFNIVRLRKFMWMEISKTVHPDMTWETGTSLWLLSISWQEFYQERMQAETRKWSWGSCERRWKEG